MLTTTIKIGIWNAWIFMSVFILQLMVIMFSNKSIRKRSHVPTDFRQTLMEKYIGVVANFVWLLALGYSIFLPLLLGSMWFYIGFFVFTFGALLLLFATFSFIITPANELIQIGVYSISRHPMYLATFLICLGAGIATISFIMIILSVIIFICLYYESRVEERYCYKIYKDLYKEYMDRVPKWLGLPK